MSPCQSFEMMYILYTLRIYPYIPISCENKQNDFEKYFFIKFLLPTTLVSLFNLPRIRFPPIIHQLKFRSPEHSFVEPNLRV